MPGTLQLVQVTKTPIRIQSLLIKNDSVMLVNPDVTNNIYIGNDPGSQIIPVPALGSVTLDTKDHDLWVSTNGGAFTVNAFLMPNGSNWVPSPAQVAAQINALGLAKETTQQAGNTKLDTVNTTLGIPAQTADINGVNFTLGSGTNPAIQQLGGAAGRSVAQDMKNANQAVTTEIAALVATGNAAGNPGGVPVLRGTANLGSGSAQSLGANSTVTLLSSVAITKPSFEAIFQLNLAATVGSVPFAVLAVNWTDSNTGLTVGFKQYVLTEGNGSANALTFYLSGPCRGNQITLTLQNLEPSNAVTYTWAFNQTSHVYAIDRLLQPSYATTAPNGFVNPGGNPSKGALFLSQPSIGPSGTVTRLCAASNAKVKASIDNGAQANGCAVVLRDAGTLYNGGTANQSFARIVAAAGQQVNQELQFPNGPLVVDMINQAGTNTITPSVTLTAMEY